MPPRFGVWDAGVWDAARDGQRGGDEAGGAGGKQGAARDRGRGGVHVEHLRGGGAGQDPGALTVARGAGTVKARRRRRRRDYTGRRR